MSDNPFAKYGSRRVQPVTGDGRQSRPNRALGEAANVASDVAEQSAYGTAEGAFKLPATMLGDLPLFVGDMAARGAEALYNKGANTVGSLRTLLTEGPSAAVAREKSRANRYGAMADWYQPDSGGNPFAYERDPSVKYPSEHWRGALRDYAGLQDAPAPRTAAGRVARTATEQIAPALVTGGASLGKNVLRSVAGGAGAETARQIAPGSTLAQVAGGILGAYGPEAWKTAKYFMTPNMSLPAAQTAERAMAAGIPIHPGTAADSPLVNFTYSTAKRGSLFPSQAVAQQDDAVNRLLSRAVGEDTPNLSDAVKAADTRLGQTYDSLRSRTAAQFDTKASRAIKSIMSDARRNLSEPTNLTLVEKKVEAVLRSVQSGRGAIAGKGYKYLVGKNGALAEIINHNNPVVAEYGKRLKGVVDDMFERSASTADAAAMKQANTQYRNLATIKPLLRSKDEAGQVSAQRIPQRIAAATHDNVAVGKANLPEMEAIADAAPLMRHPPDSGTAMRSMIGGGLLTGLSMEPTIAAAGLAATGVVAPITERIFESQKLMRAMIDKAKARGGAPMPPVAIPKAPAIGLLATQGGQYLSPQWASGGLLMPR